jgi:hypothetical protein
MSDRRFKCLFGNEPHRRGCSNPRSWFRIRPLIGLALLGRRAKEPLPITLGEVRCGCKAAGKCHIQYGTARASEQVTCSFETQPQVILTWRAVEMTAEKPLELPRRQVDGHRQLLTAQRIFDVQVHDPDSIKDLCI